MVRWYIMPFRMPDMLTVAFFNINDSMTTLVTESVRYDSGCIHHDWLTCKCKCSIWFGVCIHYVRLPRYDIFESCWFWVTATSPALVYLGSAPWKGCVRVDVWRRYSVGHGAKDLPALATDWLPKCWASSYCLLIPSREIRYWHLSQEYPRVRVKSHEIKVVSC